MTVTRVILWPLGAMLRALIWIYRYFVSPLIGPQCRFAPTCSEYADQAIAIHGVAHGSNLALRRIARCHPWGDLGYDPVPPAGRANRASR